MISLTYKKRKLTFLQFGASIITAIALLFSNNYAQASAKEMRLVADIAGTHCKLWLAHIQNKAAPLNAQELSLLLKRNVTEQEAQQYNYRFSGLPDFGFVLGKRWQVADRANRHNFNFYFTKWLDKKYKFANFDSEKFCSLDINLTALPTSPDAYISNSPPPRRLKAIVQTFLPAAGNTNVIIYELRQTGSGWQIYEIYINGQGLKQSNESEFSQYISNSGFRGLISYLINSAANS